MYAFKILSLAVFAVGLASGSEYIRSLETNNCRILDCIVVTKAGRACAEEAAQAMESKWGKATIDGVGGNSNVSGATLIFKTTNAHKQIVPYACKDDKDAYLDCEPSGPC